MNLRRVKVYSHRSKVETKMKRSMKKTKNIKDKIGIRFRFHLSVIWPDAEKAFVLRGNGIVRLQLRFLYRNKWVVWDSMCSHGAIVATTLNSIQIKSQSQLCYVNSPSKPNSLREMLNL